MRSLKFRVLFCGILLSSNSLANEQAATVELKQTFPGIKSFMTAEQTERAGLHKLTDKELDALNAWLVEYTVNEAPLTKSRYSNAKAVRALERQGIRSRIRGEFSGWTGKTLFKLENGQVWKQRNSQRYRNNMLNPEVEIKKNTLGFYELKLLANGKKVGVKRIN